MKTTAGTITTIIGSAALLLATTGIAGAQEAAPDTTKKQTQTQAKKGDRSIQDQAQGLKPQDGTGNGSPGQTGAAKGKATEKGKSGKNGKGNSEYRGSGKGIHSRSRNRTPGASGSGSCTGAGSRSRRGGGGSRGSASGGRR